MNLPLLNEIKNLCEKLDEMSASDLIANRCLASCVILMEVLKSKGYMVAAFPCEAHGISKMYIDKFSQYNLSSATQQIDRTTAEKWASEGARIVSILANRTDTIDQLDGSIPEEKLLHGHYCFMVSSGTECYFVDPTSFNMIRTKELNGWTVSAPKHLVKEIPFDYFKFCVEINKLHKTDANKLSKEQRFAIHDELPCGGILEYKYIRLNTIEKLERKRGSKSWRRSDLNIGRYKDLIATII